MSLPEVNAEGLLPPGRHKGTLNELQERFVDQAPHRDEREQVFAALQLELGLLERIGGPSTVWIDGGFVTHKHWAAPADVDIVYLCRDEHHMMSILNAEGALQMLTLQDVATWKPISAVARRLQPMGGLVDAFLASPRTFHYWNAIWSSVSGPDGEIIEGKRKGYVEVVL